MNEKNSLNNSNLIYDRVVTEWNELIKNISIAKKAHTDASYNNLCALGYCPPSLITQKNIGGFHIKVHEKKTSIFIINSIPCGTQHDGWLVFLCHFLTILPIKFPICSVCSMDGRSLVSTQYFQYTAEIRFHSPYFYDANGNK